MGVVRTMPAKGIPFMTNLKEQPYSNLANIKIALEYDPELKGIVHFDTFLGRILTEGREWRGEDDTRIATYLQERRRLLTASSRQVKEAIDCFAKQHPKNCVTDWFDLLVWDKKPRIKRAFMTYWGARPSPQQPLEYLEAVSANFFLGIIARAKRPGCQLDEMVVFESAQGKGKTSALRILGGDWYAASHERVTDKDFFQDLEGKLIVEISELSAFTAAQVERVKHAISTSTDRYRGSYDARSTDHPRQCIFAGTTNAEEWLTDETGGRRFWPVRCHLVDREGLIRDREQLFAEAVYHYNEGLEWWLVPDVVVQVQAERQQSDAWSDLVLPWCANHTEVRMVQILSDCLKLKPEQMDRSSQMRVGKILKLAKWTRVSGRHYKFWQSPLVETSEVVDDEVETF